MFVAAELRDGLAMWLADLEPGVFGGDDARRLLAVMSDVKRLAGAAETLLAARVAETDAWCEDGADRSAAHWLARRTGISIAKAKAKLETAARLGELPATSEAYRDERDAPRSQPQRVATDRGRVVGAALRGQGL